jgi:hypothetical protein
LFEKVLLSCEEEKKTLSFCLNISDRDGPRPHICNAVHETLENSDPNHIIPQQRTLMSWAMRYFDEWLKSNGTDSGIQKVKPWGWKTGTVSGFFQLKDGIFMTRTSSKFSQIPQISGAPPIGEKLY